MIIGQLSKAGNWPVLPGFTAREKKKHWLPLSAERQQIQHPVDPHHEE